MDNPGWLKLVLIGLILAAVALGYFLLSGKLASFSGKTIQNTPGASVLGQTIQINASPAPSSSPAAKSNSSPAPKTAFDRIANRTQNQTQTLPKTGFPESLIVIFSISAMVSGWGLRRFPK